MTRRILNLKMNYIKAKTLQVILAESKIHIKNMGTMKIIEDIEGELEAFTGTASLFFELKGGK